MQIKTDPQKRPLVDALLAEPVLARLATSSARHNQPHVVPVWFLWDGEALWISSFISTRKMKDLQNNPRCAVLIEPKVADQLQAVLFEGTAELLEGPPELLKEMSVKIYARYMGDDGAQEEKPQSWAVDPENRLIKVNPLRAIAW